MGQKQYPVNVITGPGNIYVTLAKKLVYGTVESTLWQAFEVLVIADETANPVHLAADLLQAEHDPMAAAILLTTIIWLRMCELQLRDNW